MHTKESIGLRFRAVGLFDSIYGEIRFSSTLIQIIYGMAVPCGKRGILVNALLKHCPPLAPNVTRAANAKLRAGVIDGVSGIALYRPGRRRS